MSLQPIFTRVDLPASVGAEQSNELAFLHAEIDLVEAVTGP